MKKNTVHYILWPCLAVFFGVLGWLSYAILNLESQRAEDASQKWMEEQTRLALWRMDTTLTSLLSRENSRAAQEYFFLTDAQKGKYSPLFSERPEYVRMYFQITPDLAVISPQLPDEESRRRTGIDIIPDRENTEKIFSTLKESDLLTLILEKSERGDDYNYNRASPNRITDKARSPFPLAGTNLETPAMDLTPAPQTPGLQDAPAQEQLNINGLSQQNSVSNIDRGEIDYGIRNALNLDVQKLASQNSMVQLDENDPFNQPLQKAKNEAKRIAASVPEKKIPVSPRKGLFKAKVQKEQIADKELSLDNGRNSASAVAGAKEKSSELSRPALLPEPDDVMMEADAFDGDASIIGQADIKPDLIGGSGIETRMGKGMALHEGIVPDQEKLGDRTGATILKGKSTGISVLEPNEVNAGEAAGSETRGEVSISENFISISAFVPHWIKGDLYLLRTVRANSETYIQGVIIDWEKLRNILLNGTADLVPYARLLPYDNSQSSPAHVSRVLSVLPVIVDPGSFSFLPQDSGMGAIRLTLYLAWAFALAAVAGVVLLLTGAMKLSERRATFVSAVTHELRTPLTTFNLYTEMLMEGLVPEQKRNDYFNTLRREAARLTHMVDNVLSFSRIEKTRAQRHFERISVQELRDIIMRHVSPRLKEADMEIQDTITPGVAARVLETDTTAVEQIFYNFADNVVKYASNPGTSVELHIFEENKRVVICFKDHGTGLPSCVKKKLFKPFSRSAEEAAGKKPGVGLGLALSREIARDLGGDLKLDEKAKAGTAFLLYLPLDNK